MTTTDPSPTPPRTPAEALRWAADRQRIAAALADLTETERRCRAQHYAECLCFALAARTIATLTGEDHHA